MSNKEDCMALIECEYCGRKVGNLVQHYSQCKKAQVAFENEKRKREPATIKQPVKTQTATKIVAETSKIVYQKRGRPRKTDTCRLCNRPHRAKGLCLRCYMREYMRAYRASHSPPPIVLCLWNYGLVCYGNPIKFLSAGKFSISVSYTHLTLPTIYSV